MASAEYRWNGSAWKKVLSVTQVTVQGGSGSAGGGDTIIGPVQKGIQLGDLILEPTIGVPIDII